MNKKSKQSTQAMDQSKTTATNMTKQQSVSAKQKASQSEYGTLTAKSDANNDYK